MSLCFTSTFWQFLEIIGEGLFFFGGGGVVLKKKKKATIASNMIIFLQHPD